MLSKNNLKINIFQDKTRRKSVHRDKSGFMSLKKGSFSEYI